MDMTNHRAVTFTAANEYTVPIGMRKCLKQVLEVNDEFPRDVYDECRQAFKDHRNTLK